MPTVSFPRTMLGRIILAVLVLWFVLTIASLILFHDGGTVPGDGQGDRIEMSG
jgi:hypothetical protein